MDQKRRGRRDFWQNIVITLLSFSAVLLFVQSQVYDREQDLAPEATVSPGTAANASESFSAPVRVAVSGSYGRYGSVTLTTATTDQEFSPLGTLLGEVLSSAQAYTPCAREDILSALEGSSVYYDFLTPLPLSILGGLVGTEGEDSIQARYLVVTGKQPGPVVLYLWDGEEDFYACSTALSPPALESLIEGFEQGNAMFAFDAEKEYAAYTQNLHPLSLFLPETGLALPVLAASSTLSASSGLLSALEFNPHTQTRWTEGSGTEVIVDGDRTLRIRSDGSLSYRSGGSDALTVSSAALPSLWEAVTETSALLNRVLENGSEGQLYLKTVSRSASATSLTFDYHYNGVPVRFSSGEPAAKVTLSGGVVASIALTARTYHATEEAALLLPLRQALAIAARDSGAELLIGYADYSDEQVSPQWLCE